MCVKNLLKETIFNLNHHGKTLDDVTHIFLDNQYQITKEDFIKAADEEYNSGYGCNYVKLGLVLLGEGFWMERYEYDGAEWWIYREPYKIPTEFGDANAIWEY